MHQASDLPFNVNDRRVRLPNLPPLRRRPFVVRVIRRAHAKEPWLRHQPLVATLSEFRFILPHQTGSDGESVETGNAPSRPGAGSASRWEFGGGVRNDAPPGAVGLGRVRNDGPSLPEGARGCRGSGERRPCEQGDARGSAERHPCPRGSGRTGVSLAARSDARSGALGPSERAARTQAPRAGVRAA